MKLKTFKDLQVKITTKVGNRETILKADHRLFGRMLLIALSRKLEIDQVLCHPLGPLLWSLANADGTLKKTNKSALARNLEIKVNAEENVPVSSATIIDGMMLVQKIKGDNLTFDDF